MTLCMQARDSMHLPPRVHHAEAARVRFGSRFEILVGALARSDSAADRAIDSLQDRSDANALIHRAIAGEVDGQLPEALVELVAAATEVPAWLDRSRIARACQLFYRAGPLGGLVLALRSLVGGYTAPVGNKPLAFSGRLREQAPRRLAETSRFVTAVASKGGLLPGGEGLAITLRVRLMHARVRRLLLADKRWDHESWGLPINQHDMLATILLFSAVFIDGLKLMGVPVSETEADDYLHLWRYVGVVIGVEPSLLPTSFAAARRDVDLIQLTSGEPDDDSRALTQALFEIPASLTPLERGLASARVTLMQALCRRLLGDPVADRLGIEATPLDRILPLTSPMIRGSHLLRRLSPRLDDLALRLSAAYWDYSASAGLGGDPATYPLPEGLRSRPHMHG
ncbi:MAG TPA: DUF2236 domain-containing protein [Nannocystis exedens]|nr:DUF2236 domain-containing protein [Nannocystis exedens]